MKVRAVGKYIRVQPRKVRMIAAAVKNKSAEHASQLLKFHPSKSATVLRKVLMSAMANAVENNSIRDTSTLRVSSIEIGDGPVYKRMQARAQGRGYRILKRTSHVTIELDVMSDDAMNKPKAHGTKEKARPSFKSEKKGKKASAKPEQEDVNTEVAATTEGSTAVATETSAATEAGENSEKE